MNSKISMKDSRPPLVFICGGTATGKSNLAEELCDRVHKAVIVNCDSLQIYRGLEIGSAQPSKEKRELRPHALYSFVPEGVEFTAGQYRREVETLLRDWKKDSLPIFVGGSGFYWMSLEKGLLEVPEPTMEVRLFVEDFFQKHSLDEIHQILFKKDPQWMEKIDPHDEYRLRRAFEMMEMVSEKLSDLQFQQRTQQQLLDSFRVIKVGLNHTRETLGPLVHLRTQEFIQKGLIEEYKGLLERGWGAWSALDSIGYKEVGAFLRGELRGGIDGLKDEITKNTLRLAKKQKTWFKRDPEIYWISHHSFEERARGLSLIEEFL